MVKKIRHNDDVIIERIDNLSQKVEDMGNGINSRLDTLNGKVARHENYFSWLKGFSALVLLVGVIVAVKTVIGG